ncbi:aminotransferase class III [Candidatus Marinamargulisbacteria bacterium SCGC AAA071-K20]|nr:aminotransferase class III [Candidatus Marinamargulisbacteria bacterium SCGC AAA071-K20]
MTIKKSLDLQEKAKQIIPGFTQLLSKRPDQFTAGVWPGYFKKAEGAYVWDLDDNKYLDMSISGIGANILGYADPDVNAAVINAIQNGSSCSLNSYEEVELAEKLCELHPWADRARFTRCGGESMVVATRIARAHTGRSVIAFCGYHGWHDWYLAANLESSDTLNDHLLTGLDPVGVPKELAGTSIPFSFNNPEELEAISKKYGDRLAAIVMEPIRNDKPTAAFKAAINKVKETTGCVVIIDEISAGFRLTPGGAHKLLGYDPDIAVFSKALGNGHPIGAIIGKNHVMDAAKECFISSTYWTERVGFVAALATIKKYVENNVHEHLISIGSSVKKGWQDAADKVGLEISLSGIDPMAHFAFKHEKNLHIKAYFIQLMIEKKILSSNLFYAMFAHKTEHVREYLEAVNWAFSEIKAALDAGNLESKLIGKPANTGFLRLN